MATVWRDRKLVGVLDNFNVSAGETTVHRYLKGAKRRLPIKTHVTIRDYSKNMNAVDRMDRAIRDWGITCQLGRFYMRIVFWLLDTATHNM
jgi:hypothetical protein